MVIAAFDLGRRRIGVAIAEGEGTLAHPVGTIERRSRTHDLEALGAFLRSRNVERVVVGLPLNMDGSEGVQGRAARAFAAIVEKAMGLPVELYDERLTSFEAEDRLKGRLGRGLKKKKAVDALAAAIILEGWLQARAARR